MDGIKIITAICSLLFLLIGADKFLSFMQPPCSLMGSIPPILWSILGIVQIAAAILIWSPKFKKHVVGFFLVFMLVFILIHVLQNTSDVGGAAFMTGLLAMLVWNPNFLHSNKKS